MIGSDQATVRSEDLDVDQRYGGVAMRPPLILARAATHSWASPSFMWRPSSAPPLWCRASYRCGRQRGAGRDERGDLLDERALEQSGSGQRHTR